MPIIFEVLDAETGVFRYPDEIHDALLADFDRILDDREAGLLGDKPYLAALNRLIAEAPDFIDAYAHIASYWHDQGKPKKALDMALLGLGIANKHVPEGFSGRIEWAHLDNRPYLRAMHNALLSYMHLRRHKDAVTLIELMLARNPNDNQGVRFLLGSEALRAGDYDRARRVLMSEANWYPPYFYELALCHLLNGDWIAAATALRRGFVANPYIAEILAGHPDPAPLAIWHETNLAEPEAAREYMLMYGMLWHKQPDSFAFVRWLFNHPKVMSERAAIMECQEALFWETDSLKREETAKQQARLVSKIDDTLSHAIITRRMERRGKEMIWPWTRTQLRRWY